MIKRLNNKGYMLIEIILVSVLAVGVAYFLIDLTLKVKSSNDDLLVRSLTMTDQGIIYNMIMKDVFADNEFKLTANEIKKNIIIDSDLKKLTYMEVSGEEKSIILNKYAKFGGDVEVEDENKVIIPIKVKQMPNEKFDVVIYLVKKGG